MYGQTSCDKLKRDNEYLRDELEDERRRKQEESEREYEAQKERRRQQEREYQESLCYASDWPDAFWKGIKRIRREANEESKFNKERADNGEEFEPDHFFADWQKEVERAQEIYNEVLAETEKQIAELKLNALGKVADKLAAEIGEVTTVEALREDNPQFLVEW